MRLAQAIAVRDQLNKQELYRLFGDDEKTMSKVKEAFTEGQKRWDVELTELFGASEAQRLREALPHEVKT